MGKEKRGKDVCACASKKKYCFLKNVDFCKIRPVDYKILFLKKNIVS
jgi:hypothetical protein